MRATAKGIVQSTDLVPMGMDGRRAAAAPPPDRRDAGPRPPDWVVLAVPASPGRVALPRRSKAARRRAGRAGRRLRGAAAGPRRRGRGRAGGSGAVIARRCPVRGGELPAGGDEAVAECGGRARARRARARPTRPPSAGRAWPTEVPVLGGGRASRPAAWAAALAPVLADEPTSSCCPASPDGRDLAPRLAHVLGRPLLAGAIAVTARRRDRRAAGRPRRSRTSVPTGRSWPRCSPGVRGVERRRRRGRARVLAPRSRVAGDDGPRRRRRRGARGAPARRGHDGPGRGAAHRRRRRRPRRRRSASTQLAGGRRPRSAPRSAPPASSPTGAGCRHERQIGTTGVVVDPSLYVAFGISGAVQHTSGLGAPGPHRQREHRRLAAR